MPTMKNTEIVMYLLELMIKGTELMLLIVPYWQKLL